MTTTIQLNGQTPVVSDQNILNLKSPVKEIDIAAIQAKYVEEREKRFANQGRGQYTVIDDATDAAKRYLTDPYVAPGFKRSPVSRSCDVLIVGGGYGGLLCAVRLLERGVTDICIVEKAGGYGGTWYWNRYPGAQCDIESYVYMPLLEETGYIPTEKYSHADELRAHAERIGQHWGLYDKTLFQTEVTAMHWDESVFRWTVTTSRDDTLSARCIIPVAGPLHRPKLPGIPGLDVFRGHTFHTSRWDYEYTGGDCNGSLTKLQDKRVAIIGTGATAVQVIPHLGKWAKSLHVFQRTPSSIDVRNNRPTDPQWAESITPGWQRHRMDNFDSIVSGGQEEEDLVADGWTDILSKLRPIPGEDPITAIARLQRADFLKMDSIRDRVDRIVQDRDTAAALKPWYNQLCKRPCSHDEYLATFNRPNVTLVDTHGHGVERLTEHGVVANGIEYEVDCLVYATGFESATDWAHRTGFEIYGRSGLSTTKKWETGYATFHGWISRGFPNCFFLSPIQAILSPNFLHLATEQATHFAYVIQRVLSEGIATVEPTVEAETGWVDLCVQSAVGRQMFLKQCTPGYYNNEGEFNNPRLKASVMYSAEKPPYFQVLADWRQANKFEGLDVTFLEKV